MTDQQTQRYRPLAVGEIIESGDQWSDRISGEWFPATNVGKEATEGVINGGYRRPIPETNWRDPVGEAGYPYPPGTVVELDDEDRDSEASQVFIGPACLYWFSDDKVVKRIFHQPYGMIESHRVIDYRPDLLDGETQTPLSHTDETQEPTTPASLASRILDIVSFQYEDDPVTRMGHDTLMKGCDEEATELVERWQSAELTRLRSEVERLTKSNQNWERLSFASANTADATRDEIEKLRAEVKQYKTSAEIIRDFADLFKQERDEARAEVDRLTAKLAKYQPSEYQSIDLTESTVFVGAAWGREVGEIQ